VVELDLQVSYGRIGGDDDVDVGLDQVGEHVVVVEVLQRDPAQLLIDVQVPSNQSNPHHHPVVFPFLGEAVFGCLVGHLLYVLVMGPRRFLQSNLLRILSEKSYAATVEEGKESFGPQPCSEHDLPCC